MSAENLGAGEMEALATARLGDLRKKVNAESWSDNMELLMKQWGEKAAGLRYMHAHSGGKWKGFANKLSITGIVVTGVASTLSLVATSVDDPEVKNGILFGVGGVGLISTLVQSFKKFYNAEEKAADHSSVAKQFGSFYRYMTLQLGMSREDRDPADVLTTWALKEYERLQQEAPPIGGDSIVDEISAASIIAKVYRDNLMMQFDKKYPDFYFSSHKGYGTKLHKAAIKKHGITPIHRKTFKGVIA